MDALEDVQSIEARIAILDRVAREVRADGDPVQLGLLEKNVLPQVERLQNQRAKALRAYRAANGIADPPSVTIHARPAQSMARGMNMNS